MAGQLRWCDASQVVRHLEDSFWSDDKAHGKSYALFSWIPEISF
jgi:hypothetical protein